MNANAVKQSGGGKIVRKSGIELLRIIAMLIIILHHVILFTNGGKLDNPIRGAQDLSMAGICSFGKVGVAIFFMITGYFLCASKKKPEPKRVFSIIRQSGFYFLVSLVLGIILFPQLFPISFPPAGSWIIFTDIFTAGSYWFIGAYVLFWVVSPQIKRMLDSLSKKDLTRLCLVITVAATAATEFMRLARIGNGITVFLFPSVFVYTLIGYTVKRRENEINSSGWAMVAVLVGAALIMITPAITSLYYSHGYGDISGIFSRDQATGTLLLSLGLLIIFSRMKWHNRIVNCLASVTLAVYLIHNNPLIADIIIHQTGLAIKINNLLFGRGILVGLLSAAGITIAVYLACFLIETMRRLSVKAIVKICTFEKSEK